MNSGEPKPFICGELLEHRSQDAITAAPDVVVVIMVATRRDDGYWRLHWRSDFDSPIDTANAFATCARQCGGGEVTIDEIA